MSSQLRDDLRLAVYAVAHGYTIEPWVKGGATDGHRFNADGVPPDSVNFSKGDIHIWYTSRGWRRARLIDDLYEPIAAEQFYQRLKDALDAEEQQS